MMIRNEQKILKYRLGIRIANYKSFHTFKSSTPVNSIQSEFILNTAIYY